MTQASRKCAMSAVDDGAVPLKKKNMTTGNGDENAKKGRKGDKGAKKASQRRKRRGRTGK